MHTAKNVHSPDGRFATGMATRLGYFPTGISDIADRLSSRAGLTAKVSFLSRKLQQAKRLPPKSRVSHTLSLQRVKRKRSGRRSSLSSGSLLGLPFDHHIRQSLTVDLLAQRASIRKNREDLSPLSCCALYTQPKWQMAIHVVKINRRHRDNKESFRSVTKIAPKLPE